MNKQELFEKALNEFDEWPYDEPSMIYCIEDYFNYKAGDFSNYYKLNGTTLGGVWAFVCTREEFEAAKAKRKLAKEIFNNPTKEQVSTMMKAYRDIMQKREQPIKVEVNNMTSENLTTETTIDGDNVTIDIKPTVNWDEAPENATHALTTGKNWKYDIDLVGSIVFTNFKYGEYRDIHQDGDVDVFTNYEIGDNSWVVLEARPEKPIYTKEMQERGELPVVGMVFTTESGREYTVEYANKKSVCFTDEHGFLVAITIGYVKPIDTRTAKEKAIDDVRVQLKKLGSLLPINFVDLVKNGEIHGVKWVGDENEK